MSVEIARRPVLRPAGNVVLRSENRQATAVMNKATKPPLSPVKRIPIPKISPPNSQPSTPRFSIRSSVLKPAWSPRKPLLPNSPSKSCPQPHAASISLARPSSAFTGVAQHAGNCVDKSSAKEDSNSAKANVSQSPRSHSCEQRKFNSHINLNRSYADGFPRGNAKAKCGQNFGKFASFSLDETSLASIVAAKKAAASELYAQKKLMIAEYGRKQGKASRVAPDVPSPAPVSIELKRCKFITARSDPLYVAYHDEEWGVPVHDDRRLFEFLVLTGAQVELSWTAILGKRDAYRVAFSGFDPSAVASFEEKHVRQLEADRSLLLPGAMIRGVVENARRIVEVTDDYGSLHNYLWGFVNHKPSIQSYRYAKQVPVKTSKSESISKDLAKRGFRFVGPTIMYSFMQAAGMTNDHLVDCYRHSECVKLSSSPQETRQEQKT